MPKSGHNKGIIWAINLSGTGLLLKLATKMLKNCIRKALR